MGFEWQSVARAAETLGVDRATLQAWIDRGDAPTRRQGDTLEVLVEFPEEGEGEDAEEEPPRVTGARREAPEGEEGAGGLPALQMASGVVSAWRRMAERADRDLARARRLAWAGWIAAAALLVLGAGGLWWAGRGAARHEARAERLAEERERVRADLGSARERVQAGRERVQSLQEKLADAQAQLAGAKRESQAAKDFEKQFEKQRQKLAEARRAKAEQRKKLIEQWRDTAAQRADRIAALEKRARGLEKRNQQLRQKLEKARGELEKRASALAEARAELEALKERDAPVQTAPNEEAEGESGSPRAPDGERDESTAPAPATRPKR